MHFYGAYTFTRFPGDHLYAFLCESRFLEAICMHFFVEHTAPLPWGPFVCIFTWSPLPWEAFLCMFTVELVSLRTIRMHFLRGARFPGGHLYAFLHGARSPGTICMHVYVDPAFHLNPT